MDLYGRQIDQSDLSVSLNAMTIPSTIAFSATPYSLTTGNVASFADLTLTINFPVPAQQNCWVKV